MMWRGATGRSGARRYGAREQAVVENRWMTQRVLLIGNGPSAARGGLGAAVDAFEGVVARFNDFRIAGYEEHLGRRTDEWITWTLFEDPARQEYQRVLCV